MSDNALDGIDVLRAISKMLWEKAHKAAARAPYDENEADAAARMAYIDALEDVSRCIDAAIGGQSDER